MTRRLLFETVASIIIGAALILADETWKRTIRKARHG